MSNIHRFKPRPKGPAPRRRLAWARAAWVPWVLILAGAMVAMLVGTSGSATAVVALLIVLVGGLLDRRA